MLECPLRCIAVRMCTCMCMCVRRHWYIQTHVLPCAGFAAHASTSVFQAHVQETLLPSREKAGMLTVSQWSRNCRCLACLHHVSFRCCSSKAYTVNHLQVLPPYRDRERGILPPLAVPPSPGQSPLTFPGRAGRGRALSAALDISGFRPEPGMGLGWLQDVTGQIKS